MAPVPPVRSSRARRVAKFFGWSALAGVISIALLWIAIHRWPSLATKLVDGARAVVGPRPIAWLEDVAYGLEDRYKRWRYADAPPASYWAPASTEPPPSPAASGSPAPPADDSFPPKPFAPPHANVATPSDGHWIPIPDPADPGSPAVLAKALVHPDKARSFALVAVVAIDLRHVRVRAVPGFGEPASSSVPRSQRPGIVAREDFGGLLAVFNGGFQAQHGAWGMMVGGATLLPARPIGCTVAGYKDGSMRVSVWKRIADGEADMDFFRQTPPCLVEDGVVNPATVAEKNTGWGATVDGETIIRRSAFGLDETRKIAFYGMGDALSAGTLARAMSAAGARDVAQLDVNWAYPRFFFTDGAAEPRLREPLATTKNWKPEDYVSKAQFRDFFYLVKRPATPARE